jgi:hypothetical protein
MLVNNYEYEKLKSAINFDEHPELLYIVKDIEEREAKRKKYVADKIKSKRKENKEYGHSKEEIERMRNNVKRKLGIQ